MKDSPSTTFCCCLGVLNETGWRGNTPDLLHVMNVTSVWKEQRCGNKPIYLHQTKRSRPGDQDAICVPVPCLRRLTDGAG